MCAHCSVALLYGVGAECKWINFKVCFKKQVLLFYSNIVIYNKNKDFKALRNDKDSTNSHLK